MLLVLGMEPKPSDVKLEIDADIEIPILELEQVSPESEKSESNIPKCSVQARIENIEKNDDLESPAFEPIKSTTEKRSNSVMRDDDNDMDISDGTDADEISGHNNMTIISHMGTEDFANSIDEIKSNLSSVSGLTSNDSNTSFSKDPTENCQAPEITIDSAEKLPISENIISNTSELIIENLNQDSILSQVSSSSRLSIVTNNNTNSLMDDVQMENGTENFFSNVPDAVQTICSYGEEAQMQTFDESSNSDQVDKSKAIIGFDMKKSEKSCDGKITYI